MNKWAVVNGTPSVFYNNQLAGVTSYNDSNYATLNTDGRVTPQKTDGRAYLYNFNAENIYKVSVALRTFQVAGTNTNLNIDFYYSQMHCLILMI